VSIDPNKPENIAVGTFSPTPISIMDASNQVVDTFTPLNSTLQYTETGGSLSMVNAVKYDESSNLWVLNGFTDSPLNVYTSSGEWYAFDTGLSSKNKFAKKLVIDYNGNKWFSIDGAGLFGFNDNETLSNPSDDKYKNLNSGEFTGGLPSNTVNAIAVDFDNEIWIGTDNGFAVLYNSENVFDATAGSYNAQRIKLEYEGNVEYVLGNTTITDIEVDGANRKWFATANSGLILLSADGLEVISQFTAENSPLISNTIFDIKLDHTTGELYIVTDKGLISYRTDATYEDPTYANVKVFPNPARPDFEGPITIQGIRYDSDIKITDVAGNLVYQTTSNGGTATWNGKTIAGEKVTSGVYLIWTAPNEGKGRKVGKVLVIH
jgi:ligand-binding sensor domain-containing protein